MNVTSSSHSPPPQPHLNGDSVPNGVHDNPPDDPVSAVASPCVDSPATPVSNTVIPDVKINIDTQEQESDTRHEPMTVNIDKLDDHPLVSAASVDLSDVPVPASPSPSAPDENISESPATNVGEEKPAEDVQMGEPETQGHPNGDAGLDHPMDVQTPVATPDPSSVPTASSNTVDSNAVSTSYTTSQDSCPNDDDVKPPPAKRPRVHSDPDQASLANSATPPPASVPSTGANGATPVNGVTSPLPSVPSTLSSAQFRFCQSTVRSLKKLKDAGPFLRPVDPVALNIPHYPSVIKNPMDFSTIERKLTSSNPAKPDPISQNPRYYNADEFIADVRLIFSNCVTFNGPDHAVTAMGKRVEEVFDKQIKQMPAAVELKPVVVKKQHISPPPPPPAASKKSQPVRRASTSVPVIRRSENENIGRPKREIHPPPPKDLPYADAPKKHRKNKRIKDDGTSEQLKFCSKLLHDLHRKQHSAIAGPFYEPVDWMTLDIPTYPKIVKKPMDLSTMRKKIDNHEYSSAQKFYDDFKLMIRNCFLFNPAGTPVNQAGIELQRLFDDKWKALPPLRDISDDDDDDDDDDSDQDRARAIAVMENQIETMRGSLAALKNAKPPKEKKKKEKRDKIAGVSSSKSGKVPKHASTKRKSKKPIADDDVLTFEQKKDLSEAIAKLDGIKLEKVIQIIHEGVPEIRDSTEEIELEIDLLPSVVLTKLYNFVLRPLRTTTTKRVRSGKGTGTGGLKRKSMDEDVEAEKIRQLEERMRLFEGNGTGHAGVVSKNDSDLSSDSSSAEDSSGSDSE